MAKMLIQVIVRIAAVVTLVAVVTPARGDGMGHSFGRWLGVGWGDGYHSHYACPPRQGHHGQQNLPWWATPAADAELLPQPANLPSSGRHFPPAGQTLFRQPGEGSSVIISDSPP